MQVNQQTQVSWHHDVKKRKTVCVINVNDNQVQGVARAHSGDIFSKKEGRKRSLVRAIDLAKEANLLTDRAERTAIWTVLKEKKVNLF